MLWICNVGKIAMFYRRVNVFRVKCLKACNVTSRSLQNLAPLPTAKPESAGLCAWEAVGNLVRVTDFQ